MTSKIFSLLLAGSILAATTASAQMDSASMAKKQKEIEKSERSISNAQAKVDKKDRKMERAQKRADRKARKKEKKLNKLRRAEKKRDAIIRDTSTHSYLGPITANPIALYKIPAQLYTSTWIGSSDPAERLRNNVRG